MLRPIARLCLDMGHEVELLTADRRAPISEDRMQPKMVRMVVRASLPETSGSRSCSSASTNSSMTPELRVVVLEG